MADKYTHRESFTALLPFLENGRKCMRSLNVLIAFDGSETGTWDVAPAISALREAKRINSLEVALKKESVTLEVLAKAIYDLLENPLCVLITESGRTASYGDISSISGGGGGGGGSADISGIKGALSSFASAEKPANVNEIWNEVAGLASSVADKL